VHDMIQIYSAVHVGDLTLERAEDRYLVFTLFTYGDVIGRSGSVGPAATCVQSKGNW